MPLSKLLVQIRDRIPVFLRLPLMVALLGILLVVVFYAEENRRGRWAWERTRRDLEAKGLSLNPHDYVLPPVSDASNAVKTPFLDAVIYRNQGSQLAWAPFAQASSLLAYEPMGDYQAGRPFDWAAYRAALTGQTNSPAAATGRETAADFLKAVTTLEPMLNELRLAALRPAARFFATNGWDPFRAGPGVNFVTVRTLAQLLVFDATAELAGGQREKAFADLCVLHRLARGMMDGDSLVSLMIGVAVENLALQVFWEGWASGQWNDQELSSLERLFAEVDLHRCYQRTMNLERAGMNECILRRTIQGSDLSALVLLNTPPPTAATLSSALDELWRQWQKRLLAWIPKGWIYQNLARYNECMQVSGPSPVAPGRIGFSPSDVRQGSGQSERRLAQLGPFNYLSRIAVPSSSRALAALARTQARLNQAQIVCVLQRHRGEHGAFPDSLGKLVGSAAGPLPPDPVTGKPMCYRPAEPGRFLLYSVGWNEKDDGGRTAWKKDRQKTVDFDRGDWVWLYPGDGDAAR